ncbi:MAG: hypothetical protein SGCHY_001324 [Lobulomycetales sp.]
MGSLFIGKLPGGLEREELEKLFEKFGKVTRCDVKRGPASNFGFVEFENREEAEVAVKEMDGHEVEPGMNIVVEWAKGRANRDRDSNACFNCGGEGHWARDCRERSRGGRDGGRDAYRGGGGGYRGRSRSPPRRRYSRSRSPRRRSPDSRSPPPRRRHSRSRSRSRSPRRWFVSF